MRRARGSSGGRSLACGALLSLAASACGGREARPVAAPEAPPATWLVTVGPRGAPDVDPVVGLPAGARLLRYAPSSPPTDLGAGLASAGDACLSFDASRVAFVGRRTADGPFQVWTCAPDGADRRAVAPTDADCAAPAWLPDGRLVFAAAVTDPAPVEAVGRAWALFVAADDGTPAARITFGAALDLDPAVLPDGRVLFAAWQPGSEAAGGRFALFTVHPDGSGVARFHGTAGAPTVRRRPRVGPAGTVTFTGAAAVGRGERAYVLDPRAPSRPAREVAAAAGARVVEPVGDGAFAVAAGARWGGLAPGADAPTVPIAGGPPDLDVLAAAPERVRTRPQGHLSLVDRTVAWGQLVGLDARFPRTAAATRVRVRRYDRRAPYGEGTVLLETGLASDGSFFLRVPPDEPLLVDVLDEAGGELERSTTPIWVRPRESRGCVGCHEDPDVSPANRRPLAVGHDAVPAVRPMMQEVAR